MKILVTGTAGFIGYHLAQRLIGRGDEVVVVISYDEFTRMQKPETDLVTFFRKSPLVGADIELERDQSPLRQDVDL